MRYFKSVLESPRMEATNEKRSIDNPDSLSREQNIELFSFFKYSNSPHSTVKY